MSEAPQHVLRWVQQHWRGELAGQLRCGADMIVMGVSAHDAQHLPVAHRSGDRFRVVCGVDNDHFTVVTDQPDVVVHFPGPAVQAEGARRDHPLDHSALPPVVLVSG
jgi:hypothetical protein